jgi:predicted flap endonuclease-1-like 5' DNA nuclease
MTSLTQVPGIGDEKALRLDDAGVRFAEDLALAPFPYVADVEGVTPEHVANAQSLLGMDHAWIDERRIPYECSGCGETFTQGRQSNHVNLRDHVERSCTASPESANYRPPGPEETVEAPEDTDLMAIPSVERALAERLIEAGYLTAPDVANSDPWDVAGLIDADEALTQRDRATHIRDSARRLSNVVYDGTEYQYE